MTRQDQFRAEMAAQEAQWKEAYDFKRFEGAFDVGLDEIDVVEALGLHFN